jgi:FKBP-type peptidyl-prolyl cis-trans isomerase
MVSAPGEMHFQEYTMKLVLIAGVTAGLIGAAFAADNAALVATPKGKMSYAVGQEMGRNITNYLIELDPEAMAAGVRDAVAGHKALLSEQDATAAVNDFRTQMQAKRMDQQKMMQEKNKAAGEKNKKEAEEFLAANKKKEGVMTTASGLQYKILKAGTGKKPGSNDTVVAHYRGTLVNGTEFDSSYKRGEPGKFGVTKVIKGWTEALLMMPVGSKWQLFIPPDLAYGESGRPGIPPNSALLFDIELIGIEGPEGQK